MRESEISNASKGEMRTLFYTNYQRKNLKRRDYVTFHNVDPEETKSLDLKNNVT
jgi:hypothetical protein